MDYKRLLVSIIDCKCKKCKRKKMYDQSRFPICYCLVTISNMFLSQLFTKTSKESTADAESVNADLLTRAGFIHKTMAGVYAFLPLGLRVLNKVERMLREEMDAIGNEVFLPSLSQLDPWQKTGRDEVDAAFCVQGGNEASRRQNDSTYFLNFSHEEIITPIVQRFASSYKDLPCAAYQIQTKFRNEARPKSGLMRGREFRMKDLYSFHASEGGMKDYFANTAIPAYSRFFDRIGLGEHTVIAEASGGSFSREPSIEFQTKCPTGEDLIFHIPGTDTYYNREIAPAAAPAWQNETEEMREREDVLGEGIIGVEELAKFLNIPPESTTKTLLFETDGGEVVAACVRGGYDVNTEKLCTVLNCRSVQLASAAVVKEKTGAEVGYAGPIGLPDDVRVIWDESTAGRVNFECGANQTNHHSINVNFGRDVEEPEQFYDIKIAKEGDSDPQSGQVYETFKASEVGNVFTLYTKYSDAFGYTVTAQDGSQQPVYMGCYGIGTTRIVGVLAEVFHDEHGLTWPAAVAPADVHIVPIAKSVDDAAYQKALELKKHFENEGKECLFDDRLHLSVGAKLADADLMGVPQRIVVSPKTLEKGEVEVKSRESGEVEMVATEYFIN